MGENASPGRDVLVLAALLKRFGPLAAVDDVNLSVPAGSFFGLLGTNGAGKTTLLRMVCGLVRPDRGRIIIAGHDVWADPPEAKRRLGVLPDGLETLDRLSGRDLVSYHGLLRGMPRAEVAERTQQLLVAVGLERDADKRVEHYSHGMRKKVGLAAALIHRPALLVLDEPFEGIDPRSSRSLRSLLTTYRAGGGTVVMSSHVIPVVEALCDHVAVMDAGRVRAAGTLAEVTGSQGLEHAFFTTVEGHQSTPPEAALEWLTSSSA